MAFITLDGKIEAWTAATGRTSDDISLDIDTTSCGTNGTLAQDCDEIKDLLPLKITLNAQGPIDTTATNKIRVYVNSIMTAGSFYLLPYTDANSVSGTNEIGPFALSAGAWMEFTLTNAFIAQLDTTGGTVEFRWASDGTGKGKYGEVETEITWITDTLAGVTRDDAGVALGSVEVFLIQRHSATDWEVVNQQTSHATTGAYSFEVIPGEDYHVAGFKDLTDDVFDITGIVTGV